MKRFLQLLMLTGFLFGQDVLTLKNGESFEGTFYGKVDEDIVFKMEGETSTKKFSINDVYNIETNNGEDLLLLKSGKFYKGIFFEIAATLFDAKETDKIALAPNLFFCLVASNSIKVLSIFF